MLPLADMTEMGEASEFKFCKFG